MSDLKRCRSYTELCSRLHKHINESISGVHSGLSISLHMAKIRTFKIGDRYWKKLALSNVRIINNCPYCGNYLKGEDVTEWCLNEFEKESIKKQMNNEMKKIQALNKWLDNH